MLIETIFDVSLTEFFQNKDSILLSKALADMIESYKKLQITQSVCVSVLRIAHYWIYSIMHTCDDSLWSILLLCVDITISIVCANSSLKGVTTITVEIVTISSFDDRSVCFTLRALIFGINYLCEI